MKHKAIRIDDLMYKGCEPHWKCVNCGDCVPHHCYSKEEFENMECRKKEIKTISNYERIRNMTIDEMTDFITDLTNGCEYGCEYCANYVDGECTKDGWRDDYTKGCKKWLESEVPVDA